MGSQILHFSCILLVVVVLNCLKSHGDEASASRQLYIVYLGEKQHANPDLVTKQHHDMLTSLLGSKEAAVDSILYSYRHGFSGFSAKLSASEASKISEYPGVLSVRPNTVHKITTTRSWDFLGIPYSQPSGLLEKAKYGEDIIVGVIDTGIWPESKSFSDEGFGPVPSRWRGICAGGDQFNASNCNRKIIGAQWYSRGAPPEYLEGEYMSPRDSVGHGTHTASTAAGGAVHGVSYHGLAYGTARGAVPRARLAIYKACWSGVCSEVDVMKAFDHAVYDGVDVLSLSIVGSGYREGSLSAVLRGIPVVFSAGNDGPASRTVGNVLPWTISVAASTMDRFFTTRVALGDNTSFVGYSLFHDRTKANNFKELVDGASCVDAINKTEVSGKMILCFALAELSTTGNTEILQPLLQSLQEIGVEGVIFAEYSIDILDVAMSCTKIPCVFIDFALGHEVSNYIGTASKPLAKVMLTREVVGGDMVSPKVAAFSSRGPSVSYPALLGPDIAAPGVSVLAANRNEYKFDSGTSMACPHVAGVVALLKSIHPDWSPAAIKSAIVTTGSITDKFGMKIRAEGLPRKIADPFDYGGGHINPNRASNPGLLYDMSSEDYKKSNKLDDSLWYAVNLPSIAIPNLNGTVTVKRTVTNVGEVKAVYRAVVQPPDGIKMSVEPSVLVFDAKHKKQTFQITFQPGRRVQGYYAFGSLAWSDGGSHFVRMPIAIRPQIEENYADIA